MVVELNTPLLSYRQTVSLRYSTAVDIITDISSKTFEYLLKYIYRDIDTFSVMALPLHLIWGLNMPLKQKLGLIGVFCVGFAIITFSVVRIVVTTRASGNSPEVSWLDLWSAIESGVAVIVACLTSFRILLTYRQRETKAPYAGLSEEANTNGSSIRRIMRKICGSTHATVQTQTPAKEDLELHEMPRRPACGDSQAHSVLNLKDREVTKDNHWESDSESQERILM